MHAIMYADEMAWTGTLVIVVLFTVAYVIFNLIKDKNMQKKEKTK